MKCRNVGHHNVKSRLLEINIIIHTSRGYRSTVLHNLKVYLSKYDGISDVNTYDVFKLENENNFKLNKTEIEKKLVEIRTS